MTRYDAVPAINLPSLTFQIFEVHARGIIGLERLMLEASGFDFRTRHPQKTLIKLSHRYGLTSQSEVSRVAYHISQDLYRTFTPVKQTKSTMAFSCLELAGRLLDQRVEGVESGNDYAQWKTSRDEIMGEYPEFTPTPKHVTYKLRNTLRHPRTLHSPTLSNNSRASIPPGQIPNRTHPVKPRSRSAEYPTTHELD